MSKRPNEDGINVRSKELKSSDQNERAGVAFESSEQTSSIFKLNAICCDDLFEWLSFEDLHSLGQTCKRMHRLTGVYFQENFKWWISYKNNNFLYDKYQFLAKGYINRGRMSMEYQLNGFAKFAQCIKLDTYNNSNSRYEDIGANCDSLRQISLPKFSLSDEIINGIKEKLNVIETINLASFDFNHPKDTFDKLLKLCTNIKTLRLNKFQLDTSEWMSCEYPKLENFQLCSSHRMIDNHLSHFFQRHTQLKCFETDNYSLSRNREILLESQLQLDVLKIQIHNYDLNMIYTLLNQLYDIGFYKRLELHYKHFPNFQANLNEIVALQGLEVLSFENVSNLAFPPSINIKELYLHDREMRTDIEHILVSFPNLRRVHFHIASINNLEQCIRRLPKLNAISVYFTSLLYLIGTSDQPIDLVKLSEERKKLPEACKIFIYLIEDLYLETKMANKNIYGNHDLIEIKRIETDSKIAVDFYMKGE